MQGLAPYDQRVAAPMRNFAVEFVRAQILEGTLKPGQRIFEKELCDQLQASRTTIREALRHLESEGFVFVVPGKGPIVRNYSRAEIEDLFRVREVLEVLAVTLFMERSDASDLAVLRAAHDALATEYAGGDISSVLLAKHHFYRVIFTGARSPVIQSLLERIAGQTARFRRLSLSQPNRMSESAKEIASIVKAIVTGDYQAAARGTALHVRNAGAAAFAVFETQHVVADSSGPESATGTDEF